MQEEQAQDTQQDEPTRSRSRRFGEVTLYDTEGEFQTYANICGVSFTEDDVLLHFAIKDHDGATAHGVARVYLTVPHAKRLHQALGRLIERHEERFGPIRAFVDGEAEPGQSAPAVVPNSTDG